MELNGMVMSLNRQFLVSLLNHFVTGVHTRAQAIIEPKRKSAMQFICLSIKKFWINKYLGRAIGYRP
jgi:hypothetical protein